MDELTELLHATMPLCKTLGARGLAMGPDEVRMELDHAPELCTSNGMLHGGVIMSLADSAAAACAFANLPDGATGTSTIEGKTNFVGAVTDGTVVATARPLHTGSTTIVVETEVRHGDRLIAKTIQTQAVLR
ncbi:MAG: PaaI family thioesterase [Actinomycetota bacterium]